MLESVRGSSEESSYFTTYQYMIYLYLGNHAIPAAEDDVDLVGVDEENDHDAIPAAHAQGEPRQMTKRDIMKAEKKKMKADRRAYLEAEREEKEERRQRREAARREIETRKEADEMKKQLIRDLMAEETKEDSRAVESNAWNESPEFDTFRRLSEERASEMKEHILLYLRKKKVCSLTDLYDYCDVTSYVP